MDESFDSGRADGGSVVGTDDKTGGSASTSAANVVMRRLTRREYDNTVFDLLGVESAPAISSFPPEERANHFDNNAEALAFPPTLAERALATATSLAKVMASDAAKWAPCASAVKDEACARSVIESFAKRAYRRPPSSDEVERLVSVYRVGASRSFQLGLELAGTTALISLPFFYRIEHGEGFQLPGKPGLLRPTSWEMASRLSYLFLGSAPDAQLLEAAGADRLREASEIQTQARRLLNAPEAKRSIAHFHAQWLRLDGIASAAKDPKLFPNYGSWLPELLRQETDMFLESVAFGGGGLKDLFSAHYTFVNRETAALYGAPYDPSGAGVNGFARAELDPSQRAGFLTLAGPLAMLADFSKTSPVRRGVFVRESVLCQPLPLPPPTAAATAPVAGAGLSRRQVVERHSSDAACVGCHRLIDPIGVAFENYDAAGAWRTTEDGVPIDVSGNAVDASIGAFTGAVELSELIAQSPEGQSCFARQLFRFAMGRTETGNELDIERISAVVASTGGSYAEVLLQLTQTDAFLYMPELEQLP